MDQRETLQLGTPGDEGRLRGWRARVAVVAACAAAAVAVGGHLASGSRPTEDQPPGPVVRMSLDPAWWPGGPSRPQLRAGTYELPLDRDDVPFTALVTVPGGWRGWHGPEREAGRRGYAGLLLLTVTQVVSRPCREGTSGMRTVSGGPAGLVEALTRMPRHRVIRGPRPDGRFGLPGTYLQVRGSGPVRCPGGAALELWSTARGLIPAARFHARMDLWVVDLHGAPVLVAATSARGTPGWARRQLDGMVASVRMDPRHGLGVPPWVARGGHPAGRARPTG